MILNITQSTIKQRENKHIVKQGFLIKECFLPLGICISPMIFSPYECARGRITPPKSVHMSHIEMTTQTCILSGILSPFLSRIDKTIKRKEGKKRRYDKDKKKRRMRGARWMRKWSSNIRQKHKIMRQSLRIWHAKDDGTWCKPRHDKDTRTC